MAKSIGFLTTGANQDTYLYIENAAGESLAIGADAGTGTFNVNTLASAGAIPDESLSNIAIDASANGDLVLQPNGSGGTFVSAGNFTISAGDFILTNGEITLGGINGTDGQLIIGSTAGVPAWGSLTSTGGTITVTPGSNTLNIETAGSVATQYDTDDGSASPDGGILDILGDHGINTAGATNVVTVAIDNTITLGDLATVAAGSDALTVTSGDVTLSGTGATGANINLPTTNSALNKGVITIDGDRVLHRVGTARNIFVGVGSGNGSITSATACTGVGGRTLESLTSGNSNTIVGDSAGRDLTTGTANNALGVSSLFELIGGSRNVAMGNASLQNITAGNNNIAVGNFSGQNYTGSESSNIIIAASDPGPEVVGESNTIRIGDQGTGAGQQNRAFIAGIHNVTPAGGSQEFVIIDSDGQLGTTSSGGSFADQFDTDSGSATPSAGVLDIIGDHGINTSGATNVVTVAIDNTITLGDLSVVTSGNDALTLTSGDLSISGTGASAAGNLNIPATNTTGTIGVINQDGVRVFHTQSVASGDPNYNLFIGINAGSFGLGAGNSGNTLVGYLAGNGMTGGAGNTGVGQGILDNLAGGDFNTMMGSGQVGTGVTTGSRNTSVGYNSYDQANGSDNTCYGHQAGQSLTTTDSDNILIGSDGTAGDNNTIRIGEQGTGAGQQDTTFIAGIHNVTPAAGSQEFVIIDSNGQLGSTSSSGSFADQFDADSGSATPSSGVITLTGGSGVTTSASGSTVTFNASGSGMSWNEVTTTSDTMAVDNGYVANNAGQVDLTLPDTAAFGSIIEVVGKGSGGWKISQNAGETIHFGGNDTTTGTAGSLESTGQYDVVRLVCTAADTDWTVTSSVGQITIT